MAPSDEGAVSEADWGREPVSGFRSADKMMQRNLSLRPFGPPPSSEGGLGFRSFITPVEPSSEGGLGFRLPPRSRASHQRMASGQTKLPEKRCFSGSFVSNNPVIMPSPEGEGGPAKPGRMRWRRDGFEPAFWEWRYRVHLISQKSEIFDSFPSRGSLFLRRTAPSRAFRSPARPGP